MLLRAGSVAAFGAVSGVSMQPAFASRDRTPGRAKSVIVLFLLGGPPQHSTWDPKPLAPAEVRGEIEPIATNVPGLMIGELMPQTAGIADKLAVLRAVVTGDNAHSSSGYFMMTGVPHVPQNRENANPGAPNDHPTIGAVVQQLTSARPLLPAAIRLPHHIYNTDGSVWPGQDSGWLGHAADPWLFNCEPASPDFDVPQFRLSADVTLDRLSQRRTLLTQMDDQLRQIERRGALDKYGGEQRQVFDLLSTAKARSACDLGQETDDTRDRYGRSQFGQSVLLARRLVEADVQFVQVNWFRGPDEPSDNPCWDSHTNETARLKTALVPPLDMALAALFTDLERSGRLDETLVVCTAEFGRTPNFNARGGRDHWGNVFSIALGSGGIRGGQVIGSSDEQAAWPASRIVRPQDVTATIFHQLGYAPHTEIHDPTGRPLPVSRGEVIREIV
ncbi:MAG: DUF1501 domain-containing protein [Planctomycetaceae bacterium]|nr:DUF1501 domain-containing protein [Planctomycetaceae bacterium]